jgi:hypothetical protein
MLVGALIRSSRKLFIQEACHEQVCRKAHKTVDDNLPINAHCCTNIPAFQTVVLV